MAEKTERTYTLIFHGLEELILERDYSEISVSDIIERSGVARSTFYSHFKGKDDVLIGVCTHIFEHVFSANLEKERGHDFSSSPAFSYRDIVLHTFYHFKEEKELIGAILSSGARPLFLSSLKEQARPLVSAINSSSSFMEGSRKELAEEVLLSAFVDFLIDFSLDKGKEDAETMAGQFLKLAYGG